MCVWASGHIFVFVDAGESFDDRRLAERFFFLSVCARATGGDLIRSIRIRRGFVVHIGCVIV